MKLLRTLLVAWLLLPPQLLADVAHDGEAVLQGHSAAAMTHNIGSKTTAGSDRLSILHIRLSQGAFATEPASATYGGSAMTEIGSGIAFGSGDTGGVRSYRFIAPPTGSTAVVVNTTNSVTVGYCVTSFSGVDQTTPIDTAGVQTATGTSTTPSVTVSSVAGNMVLSVAIVGNSFSSVGAEQTADCAFTDGGAYEGSASREAGAASVVMDYTFSSGTWATQGFEINAAAAGGSVVPIIMHNRRQRSH